MSQLREIRPRRKPLKRAYIALLLWFVGRAIQAAVRTDQDVNREFAALPHGFTFCLGILPHGPHMVVGKDDRGQVHYLGGKVENRPIHLRILIKHREAAFLMFTFQESTATAAARNRLLVDGEVAHACAVVRILDMVEVYLLPKWIARRAVKRYPSWTAGRVFSGRAWIYLRALVGT
jgi:aldehyde:ferredoxin oxidoreductase